MSAWYYVDDHRQRIGPIQEDEILSLIRTGVLREESYVWQKGFDDWKHLSDVSELVEKANADLEDEYVDEPHDEIRIDFPDPIAVQAMDWETVGRDERIFTIKIGRDRGMEEVEYGPYTLNELKRAYEEKRVNGKTYLFAPGLENWMFLADIPIFEQVFHDMPPVIEDVDRRASVRKPFVARLLFHDQKQVFEGICRDISTGGLQILVSSFPGEIGDDVAMNVHPDNSDYCFAAKGTIVRLLDGGQGFSLRFKNLSREAMETIESYVSTN